MNETPVPEQEPSVVLRNTVRKPSSVGNQQIAENQIAENAITENRKSVGRPSSVEIRKSIGRTSYHAENDNIHQNDHNPNTQLRNSQVKRSLEKSSSITRSGMEKSVTLNEIPSQEKPPSMNRSKSLDKPASFTRSPHVDTPRPASYNEKSSTKPTSLRASMRASMKKMATPQQDSRSSTLEQELSESLHVAEKIEEEGL
jgi:hypothetical protein